VGNAPVILYPKDGWCDAVVYSGSLVGGAMQRYGLSVVDAKVTGLKITAGHCKGVVLADGTVHEADIVINCSGRWSNEVASEGKYQVPLTPTVGLIAYTQPAGVKLKRALRTPLVNMRPDGGGRFMLRSNELDKLVAAESAPTTDHPQAQELLRRAQKTIPDLDKVEVEAVRIAIRPIPKDSYSAIGPVPHLDGYYVAVTHSGVTLGPFIGEAVTDEVINNRTRPELAGFRPSRFFN
jgi:glycine/D-amino acid oxidase-like deaminating enzyme